MPRKGTPNSGYRKKLWNWRIAAFVLFDRMINSVKIYPNQLLIGRKIVLLLLRCKHLNLTRSSVVFKIQFLNFTLWSKSASKLIQANLRRGVITRVGLCLRNETKEPWYRAVWGKAGEERKMFRFQNFKLWGVGV